MARPSSPEGDPGAQESLCRGMRPTSASWFRPQIRARTRFFDDQVMGVISTGISQVVVCGAGYDDRGLRFRTTGVRFFELDHPATQADKAKRLRAMGPAGTSLALAPADFRVDDIASALIGCGHDAGRPSLFMCEGLLVYLDQPTCSRLLGGLRSRAAPGSTLAVSLAVHRAGASSDAVTAAANARRPSGRSEPWRTILSLDAHLALLEQAGWRVERTVDAADLDDEAVPGRTQLVTAVSDRGG
jgi:methyltransferase (TIGR00027 family)